MAHPQNVMLEFTEQCVQYTELAVLLCIKNAALRMTQTGKLDGIATVASLNVAYKGICSMLPHDRVRVDDVHGSHILRIQGDQAL